MKGRGRGVGGWREQKERRSKEKHEGAEEMAKTQTRSSDTRSIFLGFGEFIKGLLR